MVTPSRRTGTENMAALMDELQDVPKFVWNGEGENPYFGMLGLADAIIVTPDSVNMVSDACSTGKPVHVIDVPEANSKFKRFHLLFFGEGMTRVFQGKIEHWVYPPLDDMRVVVERVRKMLI